MKFKKILTLSFVGLTGLGALTGVIYAKHGNLVTGNKLQINKSVGKYCHDETNGTNITQAQLDDHTKAVCDKLQLELKAAWVDDNAIAQLVGTLKANLINFQPNVNNDSNNIQQAILNQKYAYLNEQAKQLGIEVADFNAYQKSIIPQTHTLYINDLIDAGVDMKTAQQTADQMSDLQLTLLGQAQTQLCSDLDFALIMANTQAMSSFDINAIKSKGKMSISSHENQDRLTNAELHAVLNYASSILNTRLVVQDNDKFIPTLKDYSSNGKYEIGDVIDEVDLKNLFNFTYSSTYGADLSQYTIDDLPATVTGEYSADIVNNISVNLPLGTYKNEFASYELGDIIPGYQLRAKIISMDDITDSHECSMSLLFGVSSDNNPGNIIWQEDSGKEIASESSANNITLKVNNNDNRSYIAQHKYYLDQQPANIVDNYAPDNLGRWFGDTASQRNKIEVVLSKAFVNPDNGEYDFANHPLILNDPADIAGIPSADNLDLHATFHTNQTIKLKVSYANTNAAGEDNLSYLTLNYCYEDDGRPVKDIPWCISGKTYNTLDVRYEMSQEIKDDIAKATSDIDLIESYKYGIDSFSETSEDDMKQIKNFYNNNVGFNALEIANSILLTGALITYGVIIGISFGLDADAVKNEAICATAVVLNIACLVLTGILLDGERGINKRYEHLNTAATSPNVKSTIDDSFTSIEVYKGYITDPLYNIVGKDESCKKVIKEKEQMFQSNIFDPIVDVMGKDNSWSTADINRIKQTLKYEGDVKSAKSIAYNTLCGGSLVTTLTTLAHSYWGIGISYAEDLYEKNRGVFRVVTVDGKRVIMELDDDTADYVSWCVRISESVKSSERKGADALKATMKFNKLWGRQVQLLLLMLQSESTFETVLKLLLSAFGK